MRTLAELLERSFTECADQVAVRVLPAGGRDAQYQPITYAELKQQRDRLAVGLTGHGMVKGQRIGILTDGGFEPLLVFLACDRLGLSSVPLCLKSSPEILAYNIRHSGMALLVADRKGAEALGTLLDEMAEPPKLVLVDGEGEEAVAWQELIGAEGEPPDVAISADDESKILYTSG